MSGEHTGGDADAFLTELYLRLEERAAARHAESYDVADASARYRAWLSSKTVTVSRGLMDPWGRVDADGTVYVRTADGERVIGSWAAGSPEEALEYFRRKFQLLETEVAKIEQRIAAAEIAPARELATASDCCAAWPRPTRSATWTGFVPALRR